MVHSSTFNIQATKFVLCSNVWDCIRFRSQCSHLAYLSVQLEKIPKPSMVATLWTRKCGCSNVFMKHIMLHPGCFLSVVISSPSFSTLLITKGEQDMKIHCRCLIPTVSMVICQSFLFLFFAFFPKISCLLFCSKALVLALK